jgi:formate/nitrite transporter FocA (FNT family)
MVSHSSNRIQMHEQAAKASAAMSEAYDGARQSVSEHPSTAVFSAFAAGLGLGLGLALLFADRSPPPMDQRLRDKFTQFMNEHMPWMRS